VTLESHARVAPEAEQNEPPVHETLPELAFVMAPRQNLFFGELVGALRDEIEALGATTSLSIGNFPAPRPDLVYVLVPPHEYFALMHGRIGPEPGVLRRTIFVCAEQPGTTFFESNLALGPRGGAVFDINRFATQAFARGGIEAQHLQLGWTSRWDHRTERERDIDILFMGCISDRRARALAAGAYSFSHRRVELILSDNSQPNWSPSQSFRADDDKWDLLSRAKVLINIHQEELPYFEWLRIVQAISNGVAVVSERSVDFSPLAPDRHLLFGGVESLHLLAELLLEDDKRRRLMRDAAYTFLRSELPLASSARSLLATAARIASTHPLPDAGHGFFTQTQPEMNPTDRIATPERPPSPALGDHNAAIIRRAVKDIKLELLDMRRRQTRIELSLTNGSPPRLLEVVGRSRAYPAAHPRVSILMALYNYEQHVRGALDSALMSERCPFEIIVVDDGSTDDSLSVVKDWMTEHHDANVLLLRHPVNRGLAHARNSALGLARGEFCFILDADNELYPHCLERLVAALDGDPEAAFSYGMLECFRAGRSVGLMNTFPWQPSRFRTGNYIDAMAMIRTSLLRDKFGGYAIDRRLHGWEDFDLWCRLAEAGHQAVLIPEVLARYRTTQHSMLAETNVSATDAFSLIIETNPRLMAGTLPPE
jgi:hypothetical protein